MAGCCAASKKNKSNAYAFYSGLMYWFVGWLIDVLAWVELGQFAQTVLQPTIALATAILLWCARAKYVVLDQFVVGGLIFVIMAGLLPALHLLALPLGWVRSFQMIVLFGFGFVQLSQACDFGWSIFNRLRTWSILICGSMALLCFASIPVQWQVLGLLLVLSVSLLTLAIGHEQKCSSDVRMCLWLGLNDLSQRLRSLPLQSPWTLVMWTLYLSSLWSMFTLPRTVVLSRVYFADCWKTLAVITWFWQIPSGVTVTATAGKLETMLNGLPWLVWTLAYARTAALLLGQANVQLTTVWSGFAGVMSGACPCVLTLVKPAYAWAQQWVGGSQEQNLAVESRCIARSMLIVLAYYSCSLGLALGGSYRIYAAAFLPWHAGLCMLCAQLLIGLNSYLSVRQYAVVSSAKRRMWSRVFGRGLVLQPVDLRTVVVAKIQAGASWLSTVLRISDLCKLRGSGHLKVATGAVLSRCSASLCPVQDDQKGSQPKCCKGIKQQPGWVAAVVSRVVGAMKGVGC